jgi:hypothetical protein
MVAPQYIAGNLLRFELKVQTDLEIAGGVSFDNKI